MAFCRAPRPGELTSMREFLRVKGDWAQLCHALMQSGEFQTVD